MDVDPLATGGPMGAPAATEGPSGDAAAPAPGDAEPPKPVLGEDGQPLDDEAAAEAAADEENNAPPTTRSKTAPQRRPSTPEDTPPAVHIKRGVMTLSDVHAARAVLAEKANQHWMKGLGGGQNREGETIVNFLYKNKVGHGECLSASTVVATLTTRPASAGVQPRARAILIGMRSGAATIFRFALLINVQLPCHVQLCLYTYLVAIGANHIRCDSFVILR